ncbi:MAG: SCO family protein [Desulfobulbaceae bacterium]|nr:SCO family protein [Desulfobulbaceae bacterium]
MIIQTHRLFSFPVLAVLFVFLIAGQAEAAAKYKRSVKKYRVPEVTLVNQDGKHIDLKTFLDGDKPVILDFIYGTCTTICPVLSIGFSHFQQKLGADAEKVRLVSITIDPDNDTPEVMKEYLARYNAGEGWDFLTGKREDIIQVMKAFDAYVVNKMNHYPLTILRAPGDKDWIRISELLGTSDLMREYDLLLKK